MGNRLGQPGLWPYAISGDLPIVLARFSSPKQSNLAGELIRLTPTGVAAGCWRTSFFYTMPIRLVSCTINSRHWCAGTRPRHGGQARRRVPARNGRNACGGRHAARSRGPRDFARRRWPAAEQLERVPMPATLPADLHVTAVTTTAAPIEPGPAGQELSFANGLGGFTPDGRDTS